MRTTLIVDTETTGLLKPAIPECPIAQQPRVIEFFGQVLDEGGAPRHELHFLCDPGVPVTAKITAITGIEPRDLDGAKPFRAYAQDVIRLFRCAKAVVAHNLYYDFVC
jgi:DNA polymerase III epsilon subunit-like protein